MIVDCHTHIGRNAHINATPEQLLRSMDKAGIDKSLVFAGRLNDCPNEYLMKAIRPYPDRLRGVACCHIGDEDGDKLLIELVESHVVAAVKFYLGYDHWYPNDHGIYDILEILQDTGVPAIFHCGDCLASIRKAKLKYAHPLGIDDPAVDFPRLKIIIAHMGYPWHRDAGQVVYKNKNVYADISGFVYGDFTWNDTVKFEETLNEFVDVAGDAKKLLFGSDWPVCNQDSYIKVMTRMIDHASSDQDRTDKYNILSNGKRIFEL